MAYVKIGELESADVENESSFDRQRLLYHSIPALSKFVGYAALVITLLALVIVGVQFL